MSDNIFADIYNRILGLFGQNNKEDSKNTAVNRLRLVLMQDKTNLTPEIMNRMRKELIEVLSRYVVLDKDALDLNIGQEGEQMALMLSIPVVRAKNEEEIEEALKLEEEAKKAVSESDTEKDDSEDAQEKEDETKDAASGSEIEGEETKETEPVTEPPAEPVAEKSEELATETPNEPVAETPQEPVAEAQKEEKEPVVEAKTPEKENKNSSKNTKQNKE